MAMFKYVIASFFLILLPSLSAANSLHEPTASDVLSLINKNGKLYFAEAQEDLAGAGAKLHAAWGKLLPQLTARYDAKRYDSSLTTQKDRSETKMEIEFVQPIFDFGRSWYRITSAKAEYKSLKYASIIARRTVLLEGLALYYDLHASELSLQALEEMHAIAYVRWEKAKEQKTIGLKSKIDIARALQEAEETRLMLYQERTRNTNLRLRLENLTGYTFSADLINTPKAPKIKPQALNIEKITRFAFQQNPHLSYLLNKKKSVVSLRNSQYPFPRLEAFSSINQYSRASSGRDDWTAGARVVWNIFNQNLQSSERQKLSAQQGKLAARLSIDKKKLKLQLNMAIANRKNAWQHIIAARSRLDVAKSQLLLQQQIYNQDRISNLGPAMINFTKAEAEVIKAVGNFFMMNARLAVLIGEEPSVGLKSDFPSALFGKKTSLEQGYEPKGGSGYGQDDQNTLNRKIK